MKVIRLIQVVDDKYPIVKRKIVKSDTLDPERQKRKQANETYRVDEVSRHAWRDVGYLPPDKSLDGMLTELGRTEPGKRYRVIGFIESITELETHEPPKQVIVKPVLSEQQKNQAISELESPLRMLMIEADGGDEQSQEELVRLLGLYCPDSHQDQFDDWNEIGDEIRLAMTEQGVHPDHAQNTVQ